MAMATFTVEMPDDRERGIRVRCEDHDECQEFQPGFRKVAFHCPGCGYEVEINVSDTLEWRDMQEMC